MKTGCGIEKTQYETRERLERVWIGRIGGHLGRKSDGRAGKRTLWRRWREFELLVQMYEALNSSTPG